MYPALRKGPLFYKKTLPIFHFFYKKTHTHPILFPAYGPGLILIPMGFPRSSLV